MNPEISVIKRAEIRSSDLAKKPLTSQDPWHIKKRVFWIQYTKSELKRRVPWK
jgi:hypothetical protein